MQRTFKINQFSKYANKPYDLASIYNHKEKKKHEAFADHPRQNFWLEHSRTNRPNHGTIEPRQQNRLHSIDHAIGARATNPLPQPLPQTRCPLTRNRPSSQIHRLSPPSQNTA